MSKKAGVTRSSRAYLAALAVVGVLAVLYYSFGFLRPPDFDALSETAISGPTSQEQISAAQQLAQIGEEAIPSLRLVSRESGNPDVVSVCVLALSRTLDYGSMDIVLEKLGDSSAVVRSAAAIAGGKMLGRDFHFPVDGSEQERDSIRQRIVKEWNDYNGSELQRSNDLERSKKEQ